MKYLFLILLLPVIALAQLSSTDSQYRGDGETLINGSFEQGKKGYTFTVGSGSPVWSTQSTTSLTGKAMQLTLSAQTFSFKSATTQGVKFQNQSGVVEVYISASASGAEICPLLDGVSESVGSNQCMPIIHNVGFKPYVMQRVFGATSLNYEIRNVSGAFTGNIFIDDGSIAKKSLVANLSGAQFYGSIEFGSNCSWSTSATSYNDFPPDASCTIATSGKILSPLTNIPAFRLPIGAPVGKYLIMATYPAYYDSTSGTPRTYIKAFYDGTEVGVEDMRFLQVSASDVSSVGSLNYTLNLGSTLSADKLYELRGKTNGGANSSINADGTSTTRFDVYFYPDQPISTINDTNGWFIDANIGGANIEMSVNSAFFEILNSNLDLVVNTSKGSAPAEIACASGTASVGLTCNTPAVSESVGVAFIPPKIGLYRACFTMGYRANASGFIYNTMQVVETSNTSQTILVEGGERAFAGANAGVYVASTRRVCGNFRFNNTEKKTIRLMWEQTNSGLVESAILADRDATNGQRDIHFFVEPIVENIQASLTGVNKTGGTVNVDTFSVSYGTGNATTSCSASPCSYLDQIGNHVSSITRATSGEYALNTVKTYAKLKCTGTSTQNAGNGGSVITGTNANNMQCLNCNSMPFSTVSSAFARSDSFGTLFCQGEL